MYNIRVASDPWKPWKTPGMVNTPEKVPEIRWKLEWSLKKYEKSRQKLAISLKWLFRWPYLQFWFLNFHLWQAIIIIVYCCTHLFFSIFPYLCSSRQIVIVQGLQGHLNHQLTQKLSRRMPESTLELLVYKFELTPNKDNYSDSWLKQHDSSSLTSDHNSCFSPINLVI